MKYWRQLEESVAEAERIGKLIADTQPVWSGHLLRLVQAFRDGYAGDEPQPEAATYVVLATEKGLTPIGECVAALEQFINAEEAWMREKGVHADKFDDPLGDALKRAKKALDAFRLPQKEQG